MATVRENEEPRRLRRPRYLTLLHAVGVGLCAIVLVIRGPWSPAIGFPIAVGLLVSLSLHTSSKRADRDVLQIVHGTVLRGGIRQGVFIKGMFALALLYMGARYYVAGNADPGVTNLLLGTALGLSSVASELEAKQIREFL